MIQLRILIKVLPNSCQILAKFSKVLNLIAGICKDLYLLVRVLKEF